MTSTERTSPDLALAIKASNRLSQVMDYQAEGTTSSSNMVPSSGTTPCIPLSTTEILSQSQVPAQTQTPRPTTPAPSTPAKFSVPSTHGTGPASSSTSATVTPGMTEYEKSIVSKNMKEKSESENFIKGFAAKQQNGKLLSVEDPWFVKTLAEFRAKQSLKSAIEKQAVAVGVEHIVDMGEEKSKKKKKRRTFKQWLVSVF